jgi:hypothetical protein
MLRRVARDENGTAAPVEQGGTDGTCRVGSWVSGTYTFKAKQTKLMVGRTQHDAVVQAQASRAGDDSGGTILLSHLADVVGQLAIASELDRLKRAHALHTKGHL